VFHVGRHWSGGARWLGKFPFDPLYLAPHAGTAGSNPLLDLPSEELQ
jgi:hypothetical protein